MTTQINPNDPNNLIWKVRAEVNRADRLIMQGYNILLRAKWTAQRFGQPADELVKEMERLGAEIGGLTYCATAAVRKFEERCFEDEPDRLSAVHLLLDGGDVPKPDASALCMLLCLVESGGPQGPEYKKEVARKALVWLLRQQDHAVTEIRSLIDGAGLDDSKDISRKAGGD